MAGKTRPRNDLLCVEWDVKLYTVLTYFVSDLYVVLDAYQEEDYAKRLKSLMHLAELCVELLRQNDEHYADVSNMYYVDISSNHLMISMTFICAKLRFCFSY